jgi:uncharacterized membrane protein YtjA (UPF0391 family)
MFRWGIIFLVIALIAAALGFGSLAGTAAWAAKIVFVVGIILFLVSLFTGRRRPESGLCRARRERRFNDIAFYIKPVLRTGFRGFRG